MAIVSVHKAINLAGWTTKDFSLEELRKYLYNYNPTIFEISKDFIGANVSIKKIHKLIKEYKKDKPLIISYAGTTDFVNCYGFSFDEYLKYLSIQVSQARFLNSTFFRIMVGGDSDTKINIIERLSSFEKRITPVKIIIEIHGGWESSIENIRKIIDETDYNFIIDFQNLLESDLSFQKLNGLIPKERIEYYHNRNLDCGYIESEELSSEEKKWVDEHEKSKVLWEPKLIKKHEILRLIR